ncbi:MCE family protein [Mycobacterium sp. IS-3022]|uniref:MCE family protein n=1 Tax=Mycobacterium sp. IS-3022 TaxID=1772277 RepID=UPI0007415E46|nr:MCE family protein [Mycobacterium sp. IS-3022]KUI04792.1 mammalian cell entry protein [Mycobacterium sp. IS-3022]
MSGRNRLAALTAALLIGLLIAGTGVLVRGAFLAPKTLTAYFVKATAIYPGDQVRVAGVKVGMIESIEPDGAQARVTMTVDRDVPVPADASAVIVAPNLISARYVALTPAYETTGPTMPDGAVIPIDRTAIPVEWNEVKQQLTRLASELAAGSDVSGTSAARFIDSAANAMGGNGARLRTTLSQLSQAGRILADGSGDIVEIIKSLATFIGTLRDSNTQIVQFQDRFATLTSILDGSRSDLDAALTNVSEVVDDVQRFVKGSRGQTVEQVQRLTNVTQVLVDQQRDLEQLLHVGPTGIANTLNFFDPRDGGIVGTFAFANFANPMQLICGSIGAIENVTAAESAKLCADYLGPALSTMNFNYLPLPVNPFLAAVPPPQNYIYTEPELGPGGPGPEPGPPEMPPAVSAYTGYQNDQPPPPGYVPPPAPFQPKDLPGLMLPPPAATPGPPLPAEAPTPEGTPPP